MAKLTLNADREVIEKAKRLAAERQTSHAFIDRHPPRHGMCPLPSCEKSA